MLFQNKNDFEQGLLFEEIQDKFYNISRIFDCIGCDKCRFNGKVQIKGLGTAMKILFSNAHQLRKGLEKSEIIALVHLMHKLSESLAYYKAFLQIEKDQDFKKDLIKHTFSYIGVVMILGIVKLYELN